MRTNVLAVTGGKLSEINSDKAWTNQKYRCFHCMQFGNDLTCRTSLGRICKECAIKKLKSAILQEKPETWKAKDIQVSLLANDIRARLAVLWRHHPLSHHLKQFSEPIKEKIYLNAIENLGFVTPHPMALDVRRAALEACIGWGKDLLPVILANIREMPWQYYVNTITAAYYIAPTHAEVLRHIAEAQASKDVNIQYHINQLLDLAQKKNAKTKFDDTVIATTHEDGKKAPSLKRMIDQSFTADALKKLYNRYFFHLFKEEYFEVRGKFSENKLTKGMLVDVFARILTEKPFFDQFLTVLPGDVREILNVLTWESHEVDARTLEDRFKSQIIVMTNHDQYGREVKKESIDDNYLLFKARITSVWKGNEGRVFEYHLSLPDKMRPVFKRMLPPPDDFHLLPLEKIPKTDFRFQCEDQILKDLGVIWAYMEQGNLRVSISTGKVLKSSITQLANLHPFYDFFQDGKKHKHLDHLRVKLMLMFFTPFMDSINRTNDILVELKNYFIGFLNSEFFLVEGPEFTLRELLFHIKGRSDHDLLYYEREDTVKSSIAHILNALPLTQWVEMDNLIHYAAYRDISLDLFDRDYRSSHLYCVMRLKKDALEENPFDERNDREKTYKFDIFQGIYEEAVTHPLLKGIMFLLASLGIVDLAYDYPDNPQLQKWKDPFFSIFDGLKFVRLTRLGAYLTNRIDTYEVTQETPEGHLILDDRRLIIHLEGDNPLKRMVLEQIAESINPSCYKVTYQSFLKRCQSTDEIYQRLNLFQEQIDTDPPGIWKNFLDEIENKINPLEEDEDFIVFKVKENRELIALIAKDEVLQKYVLKAEKYHILVKERNLSHVRKRLEEFGYFLDVL